MNLFVISVHVQEASGCQLWLQAQGQIILTSEGMAGNGVVDCYTIVHDNAPVKVNPRGIQVTLKVLTASRIGNSQ